MKKKMFVIKIGNQYLLLNELEYEKYLNFGIV
jgi:hypothetical protein